MNKKLIISICLFLLSIGITIYTYVGNPFKGNKKVTEKERIEKQIEFSSKSKSLDPAQKDLLRLQLSIMDYMMKKGGPPASLANLVPEYFDSVPINPQTHKPYDYKSEGQSYSLGADATSNPQTAKSDNKKDKGDKGKVLTESSDIDKIKELLLKQDGAKSENYVNPNDIVADDYVFVAEGKRDPFQKWQVRPSDNYDPNKPPLENYDVSQLRLTAVLDAASGGKKGLVEDSQGKGYTVSIGTKIGTKEGYVADIGKDYIKVIESEVDYAGEKKQNLIEMKIQSNEMLKGKASKNKNSNYSIRGNETGGSRGSSTGGSSGGSTSPKGSRTFK